MFGFAVAEQLLHDAQLGAAVQEMRRERVAQQVRVHTRIDAGGERVLPHDELDRALREPRAASVEEERTGPVRASDLMPPRARRPGSGGRCGIALDRGACRLAHHDHALLVALPVDDDRPLFEVDAADIDRGRLADAQTAGVHQLEQGAVAQAGGPVAVGRGDQRGDVGERQDVRQPARLLRAADEGERVVAHHAFSRSQR